MIELVWQLPAEKLPPVYDFVLVELDTDDLDDPDWGDEGLTAAELARRDELDLQIASEALQESGRKPLHQFLAEL